MERSFRLFMLFSKVYSAEMYLYSLFACYGEVLGCLAEEHPA
jgi:hypothetical protein